VALLSLYDVQLETAALAAVGIRLSTLWFAVCCGFVALSILEFLFHRTMVPSSLNKISLGGRRVR
jgi:hypothetical protein